MGADSRFQDVQAGRIPVFPRDHGKHPDFRTEWWYFTGNLDSEGRQWGVQVTFFRRGLVSEPRQQSSAWNLRDVYLAHFALTDVTGGRFVYGELLSREGPGLANASAEDLNVRIRDWSAQREQDAMRLTARHDGYAVDLQLVPQKPVTLHGDRGYSRKGDSERQASYYYSITRLDAAGTITFDGVSHRVNGHAWMDHEFGSGMMRPDQAGWDWFSLQLDDGSDVMVFHLRKKDGSFEQPFGTLVPREGPAVALAGAPVISAQGSWVSPHTGAEYPSGWTVEVPDQGISLQVKPLLRDQELNTSRSTRITYWEGAVAVEGHIGDRPVKGRGYVELTGYAHPMGGKL